MLNYRGPDILTHLCKLSQYPFRSHMLIFFLLLTSDPFYMYSQLHTDIFVLYFILFDFCILFCPFFLFFELPLYGHHNVLIFLFSCLNLTCPYLLLFLNSLSRVKINNCENFFLGYTGSCYVSDCSLKYIIRILS